MSEQTTEATSSIVWFELPAADSERARTFYGGLFGWQFQPFGEQDYHVSYDAGGAVYGAPGKTGILAYFGVAEINDARGRVEELGGTAGEVEEIPGIGLYAYCTDTEGNPFGLYQAGDAA
jgi:predicted enzyme related to lactoylglutathione lyase